MDNVRAQLEAGKARSASFSLIVAEYMQSMHRLQELEIRNAQLDREASELRRENDTLLERATFASQTTAAAAEAIAQVEELREKASKLQEELLSAYRDRAAAVEAKDAAQQQLQVVRDLNERQAAELESTKLEANRATKEAMQLAAARDMIDQECKACRKELQKQRDQVADLKIENQDIVRQILELKDAAADRMQQMNTERDEMIEQAKRQIAEMHAEARAQIAREAASLSRASTSAASPSYAMLDAHMHRLDLASNEAGLYAVPATVAKSMPSVHVGGCHALAFDATGRWLASCGADKTVKVWDIAKGNDQPSVLRGSLEGLNDVAFTCDSRTVLGAEDRAAVRLWEVEKGRLRPVALTGHKDKVTGVATSPTHHDVAYTCSSDRTIKAWKISAGVCDRSIMSPSKSFRIAVVPDSGMLVTGHFDGALRFWDPRKREALAHEVAGVHSKEVYSAAVAPGGRWVLSCGRDNTLRLLDTRTFTALAQLAAPTFVPMAPWAVPCLSPSASHAAAGAEQGAVFLWDISSLTGSSAAAGGGGGGGGVQPACVRLRQPRTASKEQQEASVSVTAWSPVGLPLVTGDKKGGLTFWGE